MSPGSFCSFAARQHTLRPVELHVDDIHAAETAYLTERGDQDMQEIVDRLCRDYPREYELLRQVARGSGRQDAGVLTKEFRHLRGYQLVHEGTEQISLRMKLLEAWLSGSHRAPQEPEPSAAQPSRRPPTRNYRKPPWRPPRRY